MFKSGDKDIVQISILPVFSNVLEEVICNRVYSHLDSIWWPFIWKKKQTLHAVLQLTRDIIRSFEKYEYVLGGHT